MQLHAYQNVGHALFGVKRNAVPRAMLGFDVNKMPLCFSRHQPGFEQPGR